MSETETAQPINPSDWTMQYDDEHTFPFVEDENANVTGYGHQDPTAFRAALREYDAVCGGIEPDELDADFVVVHHWVTMDEDDERLHRCSVDTPGAFPVTGVWGQR